MATIADLTTIQSIVNSILQTTRTAYGSTPDGSNQAFPSATEITNSILYADFEIATLIANTFLHPYQSQFIVAAADKTIGANPSPVRNGMIVRVTGQVGSVASTTFLAADISTSTNLVTKADHGLVTGQLVQVANGGTLPVGLVAATNYYIYRASSSTYGFCADIYKAKAGTLIDITNIGSGTNTVTTQYTEIYQADSRASISETLNSPYLFAGESGNAAGFWFEEGTEFYTNCPNAKVYFTDTTLTSVCQSPQNYTYAIASGAIGRLLKDGGDAQMTSYYEQQYAMYLQQISGMALNVPQIQGYAGGISV